MTFSKILCTSVTWFSYNGLILCWYFSVMTRILKLAKICKIRYTSNWNFLECNKLSFFMFITSFVWFGHPKMATLRWQKSAYNKKYATNESKIFWNRIICTFACLYQVLCDSVNWFSCERLIQTLQVASLRWQKCVYNKKYATNMSKIFWDQIICAFACLYQV